MKRLSRAVYAAQPSENEQRPLKWSHMPTTFDAEDRPDWTTGVGGVTGHPQRDRDQDVG